MLKKLPSFCSAHSLGSSNVLLQPQGVPAVARCCFVDESSRAPTTAYFLLRGREPLTPSPRRGEGRDEGVRAARLPKCRSPLTPPSPLRGEGVKRRARLTGAQ